VRVVIAEDQFLLRDGLIRLLEAYGFEVAAAVDNGDDLLTELRKSRPDVAVVDVRLPPTFTDEGLRAALRARRELPGLPVLVLSQYVEQLYARELLAELIDAGARHCVLACIGMPSAQWVADEIIRPVRAMTGYNGR